MTAQPRVFPEERAWRIASLSDIEAIELEPLERRLRWRSVGALLESVAARHPDATAWIYLPNPADPSRMQRQTHAQLNATLRRGANLWRTLGAKFAAPGRPVIASLLHHCPQAHHVIWSAECVGVAMPVNPLLEVAHIAGLLRAAGATVLVASRADAQIWDKVPLILAQVSALRVVVAVQDPQWAESTNIGRIPVPVIDWDDALGNESADHSLDADDCVETPEGVETHTCALFHTGGTTGTPKLAPQHHRGQIFDSIIQAAMYGLGPGDLVFAALPLFHVAGLTMTGLLPLASGAAIFITGGGWRNKEVYPQTWRLIEHFGITHLSLVPTVLGALLNVPIDANISTLELTWCGAAPLPKATLARFEAVTGVPVIEGYGATEVHCVASQNPLHGPRKAGSVGLRLPYIEVRAATPAHGASPAKPCAPGEVGHLMIRGPTVFAGYLGLPDSNQPFDAEGWYDTGDIGWQDEDGFLWLVGRARDLIIRGGHNIDPAGAEEILAQHPSVEAAAVVARPDSHVGEVPVGYVKLRTSQTIDTAELVAYVRERTSERASVPDWVEALPEMPQTAVGKLAKNRLRALAAERTIRTMLAEAGCEFIRVEAKDEGRGVEVDVVLLRPTDRPRAQAILERLAIRAVVH